MEEMSCATKPVLFPVPLKDGLGIDRFSHLFLLALSFLIGWAAVLSFGDFQTTRKNW